MTDATRSYIDDFRKRLTRYGVRAALADAAFRAAFGVASLASFIFIAGWAEAAFRFSVSVRTTFAFAFVVAVVALVVWTALPFLSRFHPHRGFDYAHAAREAGARFPTVRDELLNALQLSSASVGSPLIDAAIERVWRRASDVRFADAVSFDRAKRAALAALAALVFAVVSPLASSAHADALSRLANYSQSFTPPPRFTLLVEPGDATVTRGEDLLVVARADGAVPARISLFRKDDAQTRYVEVELYRDSLGTYRHRFTSLRRGERYYVVADEIESERFRIDVVERPVVRGFSATVIPPAYSRLPRVEQKDNGNVSGLFGSLVRISLVSSKPLSKAYLFFADSTTVPLESEAAVARGSFRLRGDGEYQIIVEDLEGARNQSPVAYRVETTFDLDPAIEQLSPRGDAILGEDQRLPTLLHLADDYGISELTLRYRLAASRYEPAQQVYSEIDVPFDPSAKEMDVSYIWNMTPLGLGVEDVIEYYFVVADNDVVSGPKTARTPSRYVRMPSLEELLGSTDESNETIESELEKTLEEARDLKEELDEIDRDLKKKDDRLTWEEKEKIDNALDRMEELQEKAESLKEELAKTADDARSNDLFSEETMEKYLELQELMDELSSEEMKEAMERLRQTLEQMNRRQAQHEFEELKLDEEAFRKSVERTLKLFKRIRVEQKLDELVERAKRLEERQDAAREESERDDLSAEEREALERRQSEITEELERLEEETDRLREMMGEFEDMPQDQADDLGEKLDDQNNQELSEQARERMRQGDRQKAQESQRQISQNMKQMKEGFQELKESVQQASMQETFLDMMKTMNDVIALSKRQEALRDETRRASRADEYDELARKQDATRRDLDKRLETLGDLAEKTFAVTPEMGKALGDARRKMEGAIDAMRQGNSGHAASEQSGAMASLNEAATMMKSMLDMMSQGGQGGGGMPSLMQQLGQLSGQQTRLNNLTQQLQQAMEQGGLSPETRAQMQRLAQEQETIRKSLEQLNREAKVSGESSRIPADLDQALREMEEVVSDLETSQLDDELAQKQERILSRLLDAQKSAHNRDFEKKRRAETGERIGGESPGALDLNAQDAGDVVRDEFRNASRQGFARDYESLLRRYYESLRSDANR
ncbi:MAG: hypothetical protein GF419_08835 [Ignavibacteriales bacterium]|nr:hypothetical protein [Ignavibacteriales bacterium]